VWSARQARTVAHEFLLLTAIIVLGCRRWRAFLSFRATPALWIGLTLVHSEMGPVVAAARRTSIFDDGDYEQRLTPTSNSLSSSLQPATTTTSAAPPRRVHDSRGFGEAPNGSGRLFPLRISVHEATGVVNKLLLTSRPLIAAIVRQSWATSYLVHHIPGRQAWVSRS
jgi:hypothetical protein